MNFTLVILAFFCSYEANTKPAGVSTRNLPSVLGRINFSSKRTVKAPINPWPHIGKHPLVSINKIATSFSKF